MVTAVQVLKELESLGTEQNRTVYKRHGVGDNQYGVSYGDLRKLSKKVKLDHDMANKLWATGNHDARIFATMIADPGQADDALLEAWVRDVDNYVLADALSAYVSKTRFVREKAEQWTQLQEEWIGTVGWNLMGHLAMNDAALPNEYFEQYLAIIERDLHGSKNRVRYAMNAALISIGIRSAALAEKAIAAARRIGKVIVDHGETNCKTPDAGAYIKKARERKQ